MTDAVALQPAVAVDATDLRARFDAIKNAPAPGKVTVAGVDDKTFYALQPKQLEAFRAMPLKGGADAPAQGQYPMHIGYGGAAGGGKSYLARAAAVTACLLWPGTTHIIFRRTMPEIRDNHIVPFRGEVDDFNGKLYSFNKNDGVAEFWNKSRLLFGYLRTDDDVFRYQGAEYDSMHFEEATHLSWFQVNWLVSNRLRATKEYARPFAAYYSNPGNRGHAWFKRLFVDCRYDPMRNEKPENYQFIQAHVWDNIELVKRDPAYVERLLNLPEPWRSWLLLGDFAAGAGMALTELDRSRHFVAPFVVPRHWPMFGSLDWGFEHNWSFGVWAMSEDSRLVKCDTIWGRRHQVSEIAERILSRVPIERMRYMVAGTDLWSKHEALAPNTPSLAEQFADHGMYFRRAATDRKQGLQNLQKWLQWRDGRDPSLVFMRTEGNERLFDQLETMVRDPDDLEDVLKVDCDDTGEGGDDGYDETRYGAASRPFKAPEVWGTMGELSAFSPENLAAWSQEQMKSRLPPSFRKGKNVILHPEFGGVY